MPVDLRAMVSGRTTQATGEQPRHGEYLAVVFRCDGYILFRHEGEFGFWPFTYRLHEGMPLPLGIGFDHFNKWVDSVLADRHGLGDATLFIHFHPDKIPTQPAGGMAFFAVIVDVQPEDYAQLLDRHPTAVEVPSTEIVQRATSNMFYPAIANAVYRAL